jgi:hypothetical protein
MSDPLAAISGKFTACVTPDQIATSVKVNVCADGRVSIRIPGESGLLTADQAVRVRNHLGECIANSVRNAR